MYQDTLRLLDCPRAPAVTVAVAVRETPRDAVTGRASIGTCSRVAVGSLAPKNTPYNLSNDCVWGEGAAGHLPVTQVNRGPNHETGRSSGSVVRSGRHLPTFSEADSQLAQPRQTLSLPLHIHQASRAFVRPLLCALGVNVCFASCVSTPPPTSF